MKAGLCRAIGQLGATLANGELELPFPRARTDVDDDATAARNHVCDLWLQQQQLRSQIAPHLVHEIIWVGVEEILRTTTGDVDRVVHHNVKMTKTADCRLNRRNERIAIKKIKRDLHCTLTERFNFRCG
jgi:hypothetical protein